MLKKFSDISFTNFMANLKKLKKKKQKKICLILTLRICAVPVPKHSIKVSEHSTVYPMYRTGRIVLFYLIKK